MNLGQGFVSGSSMVLKGSENQCSLMLFFMLFIQLGYVLLKTKKGFGRILKCHH